jgi:hypothetical protein
MTFTHFRTENRFPFSGNALGDCSLNWMSRQMVSVAHRNAQGNCHLLCDGERLLRGNGAG